MSGWLWFVISRDQVWYSVSVISWPSIATSLLAKLKLPLSSAGLVIGDNIRNNAVETIIPSNARYEGTNVKLATFYI